jgi:hypothetical protein
MKSSCFLGIISIVIGAATFLVGGCSTTSSTALEVSGTPGTPFTAHYRAGAFTGNISSVTLAGRSSRVAVLDPPVSGMTAEVSKTELDARLILEIIQRGKPVFQAEAPAGSQGVRVTHTTSGWQKETY